MKDLTSSNLKGAAYDAATGKLTVHFKNGTVYDYADVPAEIHDALMSAESPGSYFHSNIRGAYTGTRFQEE